MGQVDHENEWLEQYNDTSGREWEQQVCKEVHSGGKTIVRDTRSRTCSNSDVRPTVRMNT